MTLRPVSARTVSALALAAALLAAIGAASMASAAPAPAPQTATATATAAELETGAGVYSRMCLMCHGADGKGVPNMGGELKSKGIAVIKEKVTKGIVNAGDRMPPIGAGLAPDELEGIAKYVAAGWPK